MPATKLIVLECGHTTLDYELVATGHPDPSVSRHLMPCAHRPDAEGKISHPVYAWVIEHTEARILVDTGMSATFRTDWKNNFYTEALAYDPGETCPHLWKIDPTPYNPPCASTPRRAMRARRGCLMARGSRRRTRAWMRTERSTS